jgi:hypothetical protein
MDMRNVAILRYRIMSGILIRKYHIRVTGSLSPYIYINMSVIGSLICNHGHYQWTRVITIELYHVPIEILNH